LTQNALRKSIRNDFYKNIMIKNFTTLPFITLSLTIMSLMLTSACGVKPGRVDPPVGVEDKPFPSSYPKNVSQ